MRTTPIPDQEIPAGARRVVIGPPNGDLTGQQISDATITPVEAVVDRSNALGVPRFCVRFAFEDDELVELAEGRATVWVAFYGSIVPFTADVLPMWTERNPDNPGYNDVLGAELRKRLQPITSLPIALAMHLREAGVVNTVQWLVDTYLTLRLQQERYNAEARMADEYLERLRAQIQGLRGQVEDLLQREAVQREEIQRLNYVKIKLDADVERLRLAGEKMGHESCGCVSWNDGEPSG